MFSVNDVKNGITFELEGEIFQVLEFSHVKPGKGAAFVKMKVKNLRTGSNTEKSFNSGTKLEKAMIEKKPMQFLYASGDSYNFMNMETYEQIDLSSDQIGEDAKYLKEGVNVHITFYQGEMLGMELPEKIEYKYCIPIFSIIAFSNLILVLNVFSTVEPVLKFLNLAFTNAAPLPGFTCWNSNTI